MADTCDSKTAENVPKRLSVVMPVFNAERFLRESLASLAAQTFQVLIRPICALSSIGTSESSIHSFRVGFRTLS